MTPRFGGTSAANPASALSSNVDVRERTSGSAGGIQTYSTDEIWIRALHPLDSGQDHARVGEVYAAVVIDVVHPPVVVTVDDHVSRVTELMAAVARPPALVSELEVVVRCAKSRQDVHSVGADAVSLEILNHKLELVE